MQKEGLAEFTLSGEYRESTFYGLYRRLAMTGNGLEKQAVCLTCGESALDIQQSKPIKFYLFH